jgi:hypothetical protein
MGNSPTSKTKGVLKKLHRKQDLQYPKTKKALAQQ